jgi:hypothetical protein
MLPVKMIRHRPMIIGVFAAMLAFLGHEIGFPLIRNCRRTYARSDNRQLCLFRAQSVTGSHGGQRSIHARKVWPHITNPSGSPLS